jgi:hypothetical protein
MSTTKPMSTLRRPMPGMPATTPAEVEATASSEPTPSPPTARNPAASEPFATRSRRREVSTSPAARPRREGASGRWATADYSSTRLANFRLPVDLHDRYRDLVRQVEQSHPRLRRPSLTEVVIALLEEGPSTPDEVAELIRRRRTAENAEEASR